MQIKDVLEFYNGLVKIQQTAIDFPAKIAFAIIHNKNLCELIVNDYQLTVSQIIDKYPHEIVEETGEVKFNIESKDEAQHIQDELNSLVSADVDIQLIKIKLSDIEQLNISLQTMSVLYYMIEEG